MRRERESEKRLHLNVCKYAEQIVIDYIKRKMKYQQYTIASPIHHPVDSSLMLTHVWSGMYDIYTDCHHIYKYILNEAKNYDNNNVEQ